MTSAPTEAEKIAARLTEAQKLELIDAWPDLGRSGDFLIMGTTPMGDLADPIFGRLTPLGLEVRKILEREASHGT